MLVERKLIYVNYNFYVAFCLVLKKVDIIVSRGDLASKILTARVRKFQYLSMYFIQR